MDATGTKPFAEVVAAKQAKIVRLHRRGFRRTEIAFMQRIPVFVVDACLDSYYDTPQDGDPTPAEIAEKAAAIKAANLAAMQAGSDAPHIGSRAMRRAAK